MPDVIKLSPSAQEDMNFWKKFEGELLDGQFRLDSYLARNETGATFLSQLAGHEDPVQIKIVRYGSPGWERLSASWTLAKQLEHANLVRVYACGLGNLDGLRVAYAIMDYPDARLTSVLEERCLTEEEGRELFLSCSEALQYLHQKGLVHTHVQPAEVVSVNEVIKLSSDYVTKAGEQDRARKETDPYAAPELASEGYSPASDVWSLGVTVFNTLTGTMPESAENATTPDPKVLYWEIVRRCLATKPANRWTARQILTSLKSPSSLKSSSGEPVQVTKDEGSRPVTTPEPFRRIGRRDEAEEPMGARRIATAWYAIPVAGILLLGLYWLVSMTGRHSTPDSPTSTPTTKSAPKQAEQASENGPKAKPSAFPPGPPAKKAPIPKASGVIPQSATPGAGHTWSVVLYTYSHAGIAQHKAAEINRKWPDLKARVLAINDGSLYLVVLGSGKDRDAAVNLRERALALGFPADSYVQNF